MDSINNLFQGFAVALSFQNLGFMLIGILLGVLIGVLPGLGGANGVAILLPLTFSMTPVSGIIMLSCIYWGALFGVPLPPFCSISPVSLGPLQPPLMVTRWHRKGVQHMP